MAQMRLSLRALLFAVLAIVVGGMLHAMSPASISGQSGQPDEQSKDKDDIRLTVELEQSVHSVLPGEQVEYTAAIQNKTDQPQTNLSIKMTFVADGDPMSYVSDSTFIRYSEDDPEVPWEDDSEDSWMVEIAPGGQLTFVFLGLAESIAPDQTIQMRRSLQVDQCALRDRWVQVAIQVLADEIESTIAEVQTYIAPHTDLSAANHHFTAAHRLDNLHPAPGEPVRHTISIVNEGFNRLNNLSVHSEPDRLPGESATQFLRAVSEGALAYIINEQGGEPRPLSPPDPNWTSPEAGFRLDYLGPREVLVLSWTDYIAPDAPIGATIPTSFRVEAENVTQPWVLSTVLATSSPRDGLFVSVETDDPGSTGYLRGDLVRMRVAVVNRADAPQHNASVTLDLPSTVSYVPGTGSYSTPLHSGPNSRRLPGDWIDSGAVLPTIEPGDTTTITFNLRVDDDVPPQSTLDVYAALRSPAGTDRTNRAEIKIAATPDIEITLDPLEPIEAGNRVQFDVELRNTGPPRLRDAKFGFEETCTAVYVPDSMRIEYRDLVFRDDVSVLEQRQRNEDVSIPLGDLEPGDTVRIRMLGQVAGGTSPGRAVGPRFVVTGREDTALGLPVGYSRQAEIVVRDPLVTAQEVADEAIARLFEEDPWRKPLWWIVRVGSFGALASLIGGFLAGLVMPPTIRRIAAWLAVRRSAKDPDLAAPAATSRLSGRGQRVRAAIHASAHFLTMLPRSALHWINARLRR